MLHYPRHRQTCRAVVVPTAIVPPRSRLDVNPPPSTPQHRRPPSRTHTQTRATTPAILYSAPPRRPHLPLTRRGSWLRPPRTPCRTSTGPASTSRLRSRHAPSNAPPARHPRPRHERARSSRTPPSSTRRHARRGASMSTSRPSATTRPGSTSRSAAGSPLRAQRPQRSR